MTPERKAGGSIGRRQRGHAHNSRSESVKRGLTPGYPRGVKSTHLDFPKEKDINEVTLERNTQRLAILKFKKELYRSFIDSYDLPSKISSRMLRTGTKYKLKNIRDFQYSLGIPKTVIYQKTSICVNGEKIEMSRLAQPELKHVALFKTHNGKHRYLVPVPKNPFTVCQSTSVCDGDHSHTTNCPYDRRLLELGLFISCDVTSCEARMVNYRLRKQLLRFGAKFEDNYRKRSSLYRNMNFNKARLHEFQRDSIKILNIHNSVKFGGKRILNKVDVIKRELVQSKEVMPGNYKVAEKLEKIHPLPRNCGVSHYFFLKFLKVGSQPLVQLMFYDYDKDERRQIGELQIAQTVRDGNKQKYGIFDLSHLSKEKLSQLRNFIRIFKKLGETNRDMSKLKLRNVLVVIDLEFSYSGGITENFLCFITKGDFELYWLKVDGRVLFGKRFDSLMLAYSK